MSERSWPTMTAGGLCHLVVVETASEESTPTDACAGELRGLLELVAHGGDHAVDAAERQICVAFTSFADAERFTAALRDVRPVRQIDARWSSQWDGVYDGSAIRRLKQELRWAKRRVAMPPGPERALRA